MTNNPTIQPATLSRGSVWRRWDLHVHTPESYTNQFGNNWIDYVNKLKDKAIEHDIAVMGVNDYFSVDGYAKLESSCVQTESGPAIELTNGNHLNLFPNVELRLENFDHNNNAVNLHVLFNPKIRPETITSSFIEKLSIRYQSFDLQCKTEDLIKIGYSELHNNGRFDANLNLSILSEPQKRGCEKKALSIITLRCQDLEKCLEELKVILKNSGISHDSYLILIANKGHGGLSRFAWYENSSFGRSGNIRQMLLNGSDGCFTNDSRDRDFLLGLHPGTPEDEIRNRFRTLKPCVWGSDAHSLDTLFSPNGGNSQYTWIKADPTFEGFKQILFEPSERVFIGETPPKLKNDYQVIESIEVTNGESWFAPVKIPLNNDLVAIIGGRGSGKSAIAELIAFAGGAHTFKLSDDTADSFLSKASKKSATNLSPITGAKITLKWRDGHGTPTEILQSLRHGLEQEEVKYLPQKFVERLCAPEHTEQLEEEIERVIFQRIKKIERPSASSFRELRDTSTRTISVKRSKLKQTIESLNKSIADASARLALKPSKEKELIQKQQQLELLLKQAPVVPQENERELEQLEELLRVRHEIEGQIGVLNDSLTTLNLIDTELELFEGEITNFNTQIDGLLKGVELDQEKDKFHAQIPSEAKTIVERRRLEIQDSISALKTDSKSDTDVSLLIVDGRIEKLRASSQLTEVKRKEYEKFQGDRQKLETAISSLQREIREIDEILRPQLNANKEDRLERYLDCFQLFKDEENVLEHLYEPLHTALLKSNETAKKLAFISKVTFDAALHAERVSDILDQRKLRYREEESLEDTLKSFFDRIEESDFDRALIKDSIQNLHASFLTDGEEEIKIEDQLRKGRSTKEFEDWLFGTEAFAVSYSLKFDGKALHLLSPGEKGIVLLLLYLEAEQDDNRPLIIDQPDDNLDNLSVYPSLIQYFRERKKTRQIVIITHNPNLVVNTDAEQIVVANFDGSRTPKISYRCGALENADPSGASSGIRADVCNILEGGTEAFQRREQKYSLPRA